MTRSLVESLGTPISRLITLLALQFIFPLWFPLHSLILFIMMHHISILILHIHSASLHLLIHIIWIVHWHWVLPRGLSILLILHIVLHHHLIVLRVHIRHHLIHIKILLITWLIAHISLVKLVIAPLLVVTHVVLLWVLAIHWRKK